MSTPVRPEILADVRRDCCPCDKRRAGVYGRGPFHLRPRSGSEDFPSFDVVVEKCPAWGFARSEIRNAEKRIKAIEEEMGRQDSDRTFSSLSSERDNLTDQIRSWGHRIGELSGEEAA